MSRVNLRLFGPALIIALALILLGGIDQVWSQPDGPATVDAVWRVYLPLVLRSPAPPPEPTPTPEPTDTPPPTPGVHILDNYSYYVDSSAFLHFFGEVRNNTAQDISLVKIAVNLFDSNARLLATNVGYAELFDLPAGEKTCFHILLEEPEGWAYYEFEDPTYWPTGQSLPNLTVFNDSGAYDSTFGWYKIIGQVRNDHNTRVEFVAPVGTLYNAANMVVGCASTYVNSTHLDPGQVSAFDMTFLWIYSSVASYRLQVSGTPN